MMPSVNDMDTLVGYIQTLHPEFGLNSSDFSSYIIKKIGKTDCRFSINGASNQYHIAVTDTDKMSVFPLITDYKYLFTRDSAYKNKYTYKCHLKLFIPNLILKTDKVIERYDDYVTSYTNLRETKEFYEALKTRLTSSVGGTNFIDTECNVTYEERSSGQKQLEIGRSDDHQEFFTFRKLLFPNDRLLILKRSNEVDYVFLIISEELFNGSVLVGISDHLEAPVTEKASLSVAYENSSDVVRESNTTYEVSREAEKPAYYFLKQDNAEIGEELEVKEYMDEVKKGDIIWLYKDVDSEKRLLKAVEIIEIGSENAGHVICNVRTVKSFEPSIKMNELIESGLLPSDLFIDNVEEEGGSAHEEDRATSSI